MATKTFVTRVTWLSLVKCFRYFYLVALCGLLATFELGAFEPIKASLIRGIAIQPDGKVLFIGTFNFVNGVPRNVIARSDEDGSLDQAFSSPFPPNPTLEAIALQPDGKILLLRASLPGVTRLSASGGVDQMFKPDESVRRVDTAAVQPDGRLLVGGTFFSSGSAGDYETGLTRLNSDGSLDQTFNTGLRLDYRVMALALQSDGRVLIVDRFIDTGLNFGQRILRLHSDGSVDQTFNVMEFTGTLNALALQSDGKILIGGNFELASGLAEEALIRLNIDGSVDQSFNAGLGFNRTVTRLAVQSDDKILVVEGAETLQSIFFRGSVIRLNAGGSVDQTFSLNISGEDSLVRELALQSDGKILIAGFFPTVDRVLQPTIVRLNSDGSLDLVRPNLMCPPIKSKNGSFVVVCF